MAELSPMMKQYFEIKEQNKDCILFYRLGDFYEMFYEDAKIASKELELTLTGRDCGQAERAPMCGVPFHSCEGYIARLVAKGYKVAICEKGLGEAQYHPRYHARNCDGAEHARGGQKQLYLLHVLRR